MILSHDRVLRNNYFISADKFLWYLWQLSIMIKGCYDGICRFDYTGKSPIEFKGRSVNKVPVVGAGKCDAVFMWWDLEMDTENKILLSCAPRWAHPTPKDMQVLVR